ncbi:hypothetical protein [Ekhidna sp.]|jgi:hypothetical protein|uniref:hypothetical protein n=1 Tax=Ekhidna sp. TaxID=2608089 RepID=UPI0032ECE51B
MDQGKFEDSIQKKFEGQTVKAPQGIWNEIENSLNAELVSIYASQHLMYKWVSVAAVLVAVVLLGVLYFPSTLLEKNQNEIASYNALLSNDVDFDSYYGYNHDFTGLNQRSLAFNSVTKSSEKPQSNNIVDSNEQILLTEYKEVEGKRPGILFANVSNDIYRYRSSASIPKRSNKEINDKKVWAGVEAGAGNFNADFGGEGTLTNSLNPAGLASAIGSGQFVNPTTNVSQNMSEAIATTIGIDFGVQVGKKWTLESGVAYTSVENSGTASINVLDVYTIDNSNFIENSNGSDGSLLTPGSSAREASIEVRENYDHEVSINNSVQFASIPVKAGYFLVNDKFSLRLNAGLSANYLVEGNISDPSKQILNSDELNLYNEWSFDGIGGLELGYSIFDKFDLTIEPNYRHSITPISNSATSPSRFLVQTGLRYTLK